MDIDETDRPMLRSLRDPAMERMMRETLREMAGDTADPLARDLARDLLSGSVTLREALGSRAYGEVFAQGLAEIERAGVIPWEDRTPEERDQLRKRAAEFEESQRAEPGR